MRHEEAFKRLPDLLDDRDDPDLLAHVHACADCQRQLFLLGRVDRMLRDGAAAREVPRQRWPTVRQLLAAAAAVAAAVAATLVLVVPRNAHAHELILTSVSGRPMAHAVMGHSDARNASLALTVHGMPSISGHVYVLWAGDDQSSMQVGRFMVDQSGSCHARFNLPANHDWHRLWITHVGNPAVVATT